MFGSLSGRPRSPPSLPELKLLLVRVLPFSPSLLVFYCALSLLASKIGSLKERTMINRFLRSLSLSPATDLTLLPSFPHRGVMTAAQSFGAIPGAPLGAYLGDRYGRKSPILWGSVFWFVFSSFFFVVLVPLQSDCGF